MRTTRARIITLGFGALLLLFAGAYWVLNPAAGAEACRSKHQLMQHAQLSDENTAPFLVRGESPVSRILEHPDKYVYGSQWTEYAGEIYRFASVKACLVKSERSKDSPDITKFDWKQLKNTKQVDVCVFRVFSSIGSFDGAMQWLKSQGFQVEEQSNALGDPVRGRYMYGIWNTKKCGAIIERDWGAVLWAPQPDYHVSAWFSPNNQVLDVFSVFQTK